MLSLLLLAESFLPSKHSEARFAQRSASCFSWERDLVRAHPDRQCLSFLSAPEEPERRETLHLKVPLLGGQTTRVVVCEHIYSHCNLRILFFPETPHIPKAVLPAMAGGGELGSFIHIISQSLKLFPIYLPKLYSFLLGWGISSLSVLFSREEACCTHLMDSVLYVLTFCFYFKIEAYCLFWFYFSVASGRFQLILIFNVLSNWSLY